jgi:hypothetical protein
LLSVVTPPPPVSCDQEHKIGGLNAQAPICLVASDLMVRRIFQSGVLGADAQKEQTVSGVIRAFTALRRPGLTHDALDHHGRDAREHGLCQRGSQDVHRA